MASPYLATTRIVVPYTQNGLNHVLHVYVKFDGTAAPGGNILYRTGTSTPWTTAADGLSVALAPAFENIGSMVLQAKSGAVWLYVDTHIGSASGSGGHKLAAQSTLVLRDALGAKIRVVFMESGLSVVPSHYSSYSALSSDPLTMAKPWTENAANADDPWHWMVSHEEEYVNAAAFVGLTGTLNRKIRRARGLA